MLTDKQPHHNEKTGGVCFDFHSHGMWETIQSKPYLIDENAKHFFLCGLCFSACKKFSRRGYENAEKQ